MPGTRQRRGRYDKTAGKVAHAEPEWSDDDLARYERLIKESQLKSPTAKEGLARRAIEADRQSRHLDGMIRNADEEKAFNQARSQYVKNLEALKLTDETMDDPEEDADE